MGFVGVNTDEDGRFELRGHLPPKPYAVHASKRAYDRTWTPFDLGESDLEIVLTRSGGLAGRLRLPAGFPHERLSVAARPLVGDPPSWSQRSLRSTGVAGDGSFELARLAPGEYEVAVRTGRYSEPLLVVPRVEVGGGEPKTPERLADVDLTDLRVVDLEVAGPDGAPAEGIVTVDRSEEPRHHRLKEGSLSLVTSGEPLDLTVRGEGCRVVELPGVASSTRVTLERGIPVTVRLPRDFELPEAPVELAVALVDASSRESLDIHTEDSRERASYGPFELSSNATFDHDRSVDLAAPGPGTYRLEWRLELPERPGMSVRWEPRDHTFEVGDEAVDRIASPARDDHYRECLRDLQGGDRR